MSRQPSNPLHLRHWGKGFFGRVAVRRGIISGGSGIGQIRCGLVRCQSHRLTSEQHWLTSLWSGTTNQGPTHKLKTKSVATAFSAKYSRRSANRLHRSQQALLELPQFVQGLGSRFGCQFQQFSRETHQGHLGIGMFVINDDVLIVPVKLAA